MAAIQQLGDTIRNRKDPSSNPITFFSCTDQDEEVEWMKDLEEVAPYCSECDDYLDEKGEVFKDQGKGFPYTKGFYLVCALVGAMNPEDLVSPPGYTLTQHGLITYWQQDKHAISIDT